LLDSTSVQQYKWAKQRVFATNKLLEFIEQVYKDKVNENDIKTEIIEESLEPFEVEEGSKKGTNDLI
jgi:hypothetical protein